MTRRLKRVGNFLTSASSSRKKDVGEATTTSTSITDHYAGNKKKTMLVHVMSSPTKEVAKPFKTKLYSQEVTWKKRTWAVEPLRIITDFQGNAHLYLSVNDSSTLSFRKDHVDKCRKCGGRMTIDARNFRDLTKRKTIQSLWGVDPLPMMLMIIMGIVIMGMVVVVIYLYQDNTKTHTQLERYLPAPTTNTTTGNGNGGTCTGSGCPKS